MKQLAIFLALLIPSLAPIESAFGMGQCQYGSPTRKHRARPKTFHAKKSKDGSPAVSWFVEEFGSHGYDALAVPNGGSIPQSIMLSMWAMVKFPDGSVNFNWDSVPTYTCTGANCDASCGPGCVNNIPIQNDPYGNESFCSYPGESTLFVSGTVSIPSTDPNNPNPTQVPLTDSFTWNCENTAPVADFTILTSPNHVGLPVVIQDSSTNTSGNFNDLSFLNPNFTVTKPDGSPANVFPDPHYNTPHLQNFVPDQPGAYTVQLMEDNCILPAASPQTLTLNVTNDVNFSAGNIIVSQGQKSGTTNIVANGLPPETKFTYSWSNPEHGAANVNSGLVTYTPNLGFAGHDSFTVQISGGGNSGTVQITADVKQAVFCRRFGRAGRGEKRIRPLTDSQQQTCGNPPVGNPPGGGSPTNPCGAGPSAAGALALVSVGTPAGGGPTGGLTCGDPVNIVEGSLTETVTDFYVAGRTAATALSFTRTYQAFAAAPAGDLGPNWRHESESMLQIDTGTNPDITWIDETGGPWSFLANPPSNVYTPPDGGAYQLTKFSDHYELLRKVDNTVYRFSLAGLLTQKTDPHGELITYTYDANGKLASKSAPLAGTIAFGRDSSGRITSVTRVRDNLTYSYSYDANGRLSQVTDFGGRVYKYTYVTDHPGTFQQGMLASITDPLGRVTRFTYYDDGRAYQQFEPGNGARTFTYGDHVSTMRDVDGFTTKYFYNDGLQVTKIVQPDGARQYRRWNNGLLVASGVDYGGLTTYSYDDSGNVISVQKPEDPTPSNAVFDVKLNRPTTITPPVGAAISHSVDGRTGDVNQTQRGSLSITYRRDSFGNIVSTSNGQATATDQRNADGLLTYKFDLHNPETRSYDSRERLVRSQFQSGRIVTYIYDDYDRVLTTTDSSGPTISNVYDLMGRLLERDVSAGGEVQKTTYLYDDRDRLVSSTDALGRVTAYSYDPVSITEKPVAITDPAGRITRFAYDKLHRLTKRIDANGAVTSYTYDSRGNITSVTDANGNVTSYAYDRNNRKVRETRPSVAGTSSVNRTTLYFYDAGGRLLRELEKSATGGTDRSINYAYDDLDRLVRKIVQRESAGSVTVDDDSTYSYENILDASLMISAVNGVANVGFVNETAPPYALTGFTVSAAQGENPFGLIQGAFAITRDVTGEIASVAKDGTVIYQKTYDPAGRLIGMTTAGGFTSNLSYDSFGHRVGVLHSDGTSGSFQFDLLNRITSLNWSTPSGAISEVLSYDPLTGDIVGLQREGGVSDTIAYNAVDQLVSSTGAESRSYSLDLLENRLGDSLNGNGTFVSNFLVNNGLSTYLADPDGFGDTIKETSAAGVKNYAYRADDHLNGVQIGSTQVAYYFDALGRRVAKVVNQGGQVFTQSFLHLGSEDQILMAKAGDGTVTTYLDGSGVDEHLAEVKNGVGKGYVTDHLGSVLNGDAAGSSHRFSLYGAPTSVAAVMSTSSSPVMYGFTGREYEAESGLNYHRQREANPNTGTWLSQDSLGSESGDLNYFRYANSSPVINLDPTGNKIVITDGSVQPLYTDMRKSVKQFYSSAMSVLNEIDSGWGGIVAVSSASADDMKNLQCASGRPWKDSTVGQTIRTAAGGAVILIRNDRLTPNLVTNQITLLHEFRHAWQIKHGATDPGSDPNEADAYSFANQLGVNSPSDYYPSK